VYGDNILDNIMVLKVLILNIKNILYFIGKLIKYIKILKL